MSALVIAIFSFIGSGRVLHTVRCGAWHAVSSGALSIGNAEFHLPMDWCPIGANEGGGTALVMVPPSRGSEALVVYAGPLSPNSIPENGEFPEQMVLQGFERRRDGAARVLEVDGHRGYRVQYVSSDPSAGQRAVYILWALPFADFSLVAPGIPPERVTDIERLLRTLSVPLEMQSAAQ